jgi:ATP synthase subunit 6
MIGSPLEQFEIVAIGPKIRLPSLWLGLDEYYIPMTNQSVVMGIGVGVMIYTMYYLISINSTMIANRYQKGMEMIYTGLLDLVKKNVGYMGIEYFPIIFIVGTFIFMCNLIGMIPYSFTVTSHIIMTLVMSMALFIGVNIIAAARHGVITFQLFLPEGTSIGLAMILIPIEIISYVFRLISLSVRLFANMLSGHVLLKVIIGFA